MVMLLMRGIMYIAAVIEYSTSSYGQSNWPVSPHPGSYFAIPTVIKERSPSRLAMQSIGYEERSVNKHFPGKKLYWREDNRATDN
jgi:hypothetical protein